MEGHHPTRGLSMLAQETAVAFDAVADADAAQRCPERCLIGGDDRFAQFLLQIVQHVDGGEVGAAEENHVALRPVDVACQAEQRFRRHAADAAPFFLRLAELQSIPGRDLDAAGPQPVGLIFAFSRKKFVGSYLFFRATSRS